MKEQLRAAAYKIDYFLLKCFGMMLIQSKGIRKVHFSIDDVFLLLTDESNFILDDLRRLNTEYDLVSHLFLFYNYKGRIMKEVPIVLKNLKYVDYGAHQAEYIDETYEKIGAGSISEYVRLHEFKATRQQLMKLKKYGVVGVLTADSTSRISYQLDDEICRNVSAGSVVELDNIRYLKTDIRLEKLIFYQLLKKPKTDTLVIFTHESKYKLVNARLNLLCAQRYQADVEFI